METARRNSRPPGVRPSAGRHDVQWLLTFYHSLHPASPERAMEMTASSRYTHGLARKRGASSVPNSTTSPTDGSARIIALNASATRHREGGER